MVKIIDRWLFNPIFQFDSSIANMSFNLYAFPLSPKEYAPRPVPSLEEWRQLWSVWDLVTTKMIPSDALMEQPIPLRNPLLFYLGHIPTLCVRQI